MKGVNLGLKVMKRLFVVFLVLGALMSVEAWGADNKNNAQGNPIEMVQKNTTYISDSYNKLVSLAQKVTKKLVSTAYKNISSTFNNIVSLLLATIAFFWLFKHLKNGTISREEVFKALIFVIVFAVVYVLLNSYTAYKGFCSIFDIPKHLVSSALNAEGGDIGTRLNNTFQKPFSLVYKIAPETIQYYMDKASIWEKVGAVLLGIFTGGTLTILYLLFIICAVILIIAIIIIQMYATFLSGIYLAFLPITIPLLLIPQTKGIFFACVKSYIGISMYFPLSMIPVSIVSSATDLIIAQDDSILVTNIPFYTLCGIVSCIIGILLLYKMPTWISELLGVANQGVGAGGALGMMKTAGQGYGKLGQAAIGNVLDSKSVKGGVARTLANVATGGAYAPIASAASAIKNGFKTIGKHFSGKIK